MCIRDRYSDRNFSDFVSYLDFHNLCCNRLTSLHFVPKVAPQKEGQKILEAMKYYNFSKLRGRQYNWDTAAIDSRAVCEMICLVEAKHNAPQNKLDTV